MRTFKIIGVALAAALAFPAQLLAHTGLYMNGSVGQAYVDDNGLDDNDFSFGIGAGWRLWDNFGFEIGYQDLGTMGESAGNLSASVEADGFYAGLSGKIPLYDGGTGWYLSARGGGYWYDITGRVSDGATSVRFDEGDNDFYFGVGAGYDFNEQFGVGLGYDIYQLGDGDTEFNFDVIALTGEVRF
jgi:OOP family OmpA-OmpF porin/outer membrane immunogenic protein